MPPQNRRPFFLARKERSRVPPPVSSPPVPSAPLPTPPPPPSVQPPLLQHTLLTPPTLTASELQLILRRRTNNLHLPDDLHTALAETLATTQTLIAAFLLKFHLLRTRRSASFKQNHPTATTLIRVLCLSQLRPLRLLARPLLRAIRPLAWLLSPAHAMALPALADLLLDGVLLVLRRAPPAPLAPAKAAQHAVQELSVTAMSLRDALQQRVRTGRHRMDEFVATRQAELHAIREEFDAKLAAAAAPFLPGVPFRAEDDAARTAPHLAAFTPPVADDVTIRTPVKGLDFRASRGLQDLSADTPRRHLAVPTPVVPLLPRSIARGSDGASPPPAGGS